MRYLLFFSLMSAFHALSQDTLSLEACFEKVEKSRYSLILDNANLSSSEVNLKFHKFTLLPNVSASTGFGPAFGRFLDPISNQFSSSQFNSQLMSINSSMTLFNGLNYFKRRNELQLIQNRAEVTRNQSLNDLYTEIVSLYADLCLKQSQIRLSDQRIEQFDQLLAVQRQLFSAGKITQVDTLRAQNLVLKEQSEKVRLSEMLRRAEWQLNVLMGVDLAEEHAYDITQVSATRRKGEQDEVYLLKKKAIELELLIVEAKMAHSEMMPRITLSGSVGTSYSTSLKDLDDPFNHPVAYRDQLGRNLYQNIGFQVSIPIFSNGNNVKNKRLRKIKEDQLIAETELLEINLQRKQQEVELAYSSALRRIQQLEMSVDNLEKIYKITMESYKNGKITFSELQDVFVEWQSEIVNLESINFELIRIELMRTE